MFPCRRTFLNNIFGFGTIVSEPRYWPDGTVTRDCQCDCSSSAYFAYGRTLDLRQHGTRQDGWIEACSVVLDNSNNRQAMRTVLPFMDAAVWIDEWTAVTPLMSQADEVASPHFYVRQKRYGYKSANANSLNLSDPYLLWYATVNGQILYDAMPKTWDESSTESWKFAYFTGGIQTGDTITIKWFVNESLVDMEAFETTFTRNDEIVDFRFPAEPVDRTVSWKLSAPGGKTYLFSDPLIDITPDPNSKDNYVPGKDYGTGEETFKHISVTGATFTVCGLARRENFVTEGSALRGFASSRLSSPFLVDERSPVRWVEVPFFFKSKCNIFGIEVFGIDPWSSCSTPNVRPSFSFGRPPGFAPWTDNSPPARELFFESMGGTFSVNGHQMVPLVPDDGIHGDTSPWPYFTETGEPTARFLYKKNPMIEQFGHPCIGPTIKETSGFQLP